MWLHDDTFLSGIYTTEIPDVSRKESFAVNMAATEESQLRNVALRELPSQFQQHSITAATDESAGNLQISSIPLFRLTLGLLLGLLLTESFVAWYLGNARS